MPKVSILVPAYNVELFLSRCLDSVLEQTYDDFEVILVDDGSLDGTPAICDDYAKRDARIKVLHQENRGISATRELCLQYASGDYVQFVDSDDWIEPNMLEILLGKAVECEADVVGCSFFIEEKTSNVVCTYYESKDTFLEDVLRNRWGVLWKILIKKSLLYENDIHFPLGVNGGEDFIVVSEVLALAEKVVCVKDVLYHYNRMNEHSFIAKVSYEKLLDQYKATEIVQQFMRENMKEYNLHLLDCRKASVKYSLLKNAFFKAYKLYPEIDSFAINQKRSVKSKFMFICSYLMNRIKGA